MKDKRILGRWKSDKRKTMGYLKRYCRITKKQERFFDALFGKMSIRITEKYIYTQMPKIKFKRGHKVCVFDSFDDKSEYKVIGKDDDKVAIISKNVFDEDEISLIHIEEKHIWMNVSDSTFFCNVNWREYFKAI